MKLGSEHEFDKHSLDGLIKREMQIGDDRDRGNVVYATTRQEEVMMHHVSQPRVRYTSEYLDSMAIINISLKIAQSQTVGPHIRDVLSIFCPYCLLPREPTNSSFYDIVVFFFAGL